MYDLRRVTLLIKTGCGVRVLRLKQSLCFLPKGRQEEADENNLHARDRKRDGGKEERRRGKT